MTAGERFWETDIKAVRRSNRSTIRRRFGNGGTGDKTHTLDNILESDEKNGKHLGTALEQALKEAADDETFRKVKRMSYSNNAAEEITQRLGITSNGKPINNTTASPSAIRNSKMNADLSVLDQLVSSLLDRQNQSPPSSNARESSRLSRFKSLSFRNRRSSNRANSSNELNMFTTNSNGFGQSTTAMPTILEGGTGNVVTSTAVPQQSTSAINSSSLDRRHQGSGVRQILNSIKNAPHRFSQSFDGHQRLNDEETNNLTRNMLD